MPISPWCRPRLARWFPDAYELPPDMDVVRAKLATCDRMWAERFAATAIDRRQSRGRPLAADRLDQPGDQPRRRSAEIGWWIDTGSEGAWIDCAVTAVIDHAFGPLGMHRVGPSVWGVLAIRRMPARC
jgi:ribosomal-protein-serine acetyltransferase